MTVWSCWNAEMRSANGVIGIEKRRIVGRSATKTPVPWLAGVARLEFLLPPAEQVAGPFGGLPASSPRSSAQRQKA